MTLGDVLTTLEDNHPLVLTIGLFEESQTLMDIHRNFTACKVLTAYMDWRDDLTSEQARVVQSYLTERMKTIQPGEHKPERFS